jgi:hypothetical protein
MNKGRVLTCAKLALVKTTSLEASHATSSSAAATNTDRPIQRTRNTETGIWKIEARLEVFGPPAAAMLSAKDLNVLFGVLGTSTDTFEQMQQKTERAFATRTEHFSKAMCTIAVLLQDNVLSSLVTLRSPFSSASQKKKTQKKGTLGRAVPLVYAAHSQVFCWRGGGARPQRESVSAVAG